MTHDPDKKVVIRTAELAIGKLSPRPGDIIIVRVDDEALLPYARPLADWLQSKIPHGVEAILVGPSVTFEVIRKEDVDAAE